MLAFYLFTLISSLSPQIYVPEDKCKCCMNNTQNFLNKQGRFDLSSYDICSNANICQDKTKLSTKEVARIAIKTAIRDTISKYESEITDSNDGNYEATEEVLKLFDTIYDLSTSAIDRALQEEDVQQLIKDIMARVKKEKKQPNGFSPAKRFLLWIGEVVLNNKTLNRLFKEGFEWLVGVTVDAE